MPVTIVHPGNESVPKAAIPPARLASLTGKKIGLLDISKPGGSFFLDRLEEILRNKVRRGRCAAHEKADVLKERAAADHRATARHGCGGGRAGGLRVVHNVQFARYVEAGKSWHRIRAGGDARIHDRRASPSGCTGTSSS